MTDSEREGLATLALARQDISGSYLDLLVRDRMRAHAHELVKIWWLPVTFLLAALGFVGYRYVSEIKEQATAIEALQRHADQLNIKFEDAQRDLAKIDTGIDKAKQALADTQGRVSADMLRVANTVGEQNQRLGDLMTQQRLARDQIGSMVAAAQGQLENVVNKATSESGRLGGELVRMQDAARELRREYDAHGRALDAVTFEYVVLGSHESSRPIELPTTKGVSTLVLTTTDVDDHADVSYSVDNVQRATLHLTREQRGQWIALDGTDGQFGMRLDQIFHAKGGIRDFVALSIKRKGQYLPDNATSNPGSPLRAAAIGR